jgi:hypothetical protein
MSKKPANGTMFQHSFQVVALRTRVSETGTLQGKYVMRCVADDRINPKGNFGFTAKQLDEMASTLGLNDWTALPRAIAKGGAQLHVTAQFCAEGEQSPDDPSIVYTSDWYRVTDSVLELGEAGDEYVDEIATKSATDANEEARKNDRLKAQSLRIAALLGRNVTVKPAQNQNVEDDDDVEDDVELAPAKGARGNKK